MFIVISKGDTMNKIQRTFIFLTIVPILLSACGGRGTVKEAQSSRAREKNPNISAADSQALVEGNNTFALNLYQALRSQDGNMILSPFSISLALAMTYAGARGDTEAQMADVLHFSPQEQIHPAFNALDLALEDSSLVLDEDQEPMKLSVANSIWAEQTMNFLPDFLDTLSVNYGAGIRLLDFANKPDPSRREINDWVSDETKGKIKNLLPQNSVDANTKMVLVNAIYFNANWLKPFDANDSYDGVFQLLDGSEARVRMMGMQSDLNYMVGDGYAMVELPYAGGTAAMDLLVPKEGNFKEIEAQVDKEMLDDALVQLKPTSLNLRMPKFTFDSFFPLSDTLKGMGMPLAFDSGNADFSGMTNDQELFIGDVIHKAFVWVDEKGTEAAAATAVIMEAASAALAQESLIIDHPFLFFIRDAKSGQILFMGRVLKP